MSLTFLPASEGDLPLLFRLNRKLILSYEDLQAENESRILRWTEQNLRRNLLHIRQVLREDTPVGYFCLMPDGELDSLFVLPRYRNQGIGTKLLKHCIEESEKPVYFYVFRENKDAIRLYERMGFRVTEHVSPTRSIMTYQPSDG